jgi:hypothetical protein
MSDIDLNALRGAAEYLQQALSENPKSEYAERAGAVRVPRYIQCAESAKRQLHVAHHLVDVFDAFGYGHTRNEVVDLALKNAQMAVESLVLLKAEFERGE